MSHRMEPGEKMDEATRRVAIAGVPRSGKTTLGGEGAKSTDDLMGLGWSGASEAASGWFDEPGPLAVEGVAVPRALRKWLAAHPTGRPVDEVVWLGAPRQRLGGGQKAMGKGAETVMRAIRGELERRGVKVRGLR